MASSAPGPRASHLDRLRERARRIACHLVDRRRIACASPAPMGVPNSTARRASAAPAVCLASRYSAMPGQVAPATTGITSRAPASSDAVIGGQQRVQGRAAAVAVRDRDGDGGTALQPPQRSFPLAHQRDSQQVAGPPRPGAPDTWRITGLFASLSSARSHSPASSATVSAVSGPRPSIRMRQIADPGQDGRHPLGAAVTIGSTPSRSLIRVPWSSGRRNRPAWSTPSRSSRS